MDLDELAIRMYTAYSTQAGGVTFDGKPLPTWDQLGADRQNCWLAAAEEAEDYLSEFCI